MEGLVIVRGAGDLATGVIARLYRAGFKVAALEVENPSMIRRTVSLGQCVYEGEYKVEDISSKLLRLDDSVVTKVEDTINSGIVPVIIDPSGQLIDMMKPKVVVDAILAKRNLGTHIGMADVVIGLGPGFVAKEDVHAVVETMRGHDLGRVFYEGSALKDTGIPGLIAGEGINRVVKSPCAGVVKNIKGIGDKVEKGETIMFVDDQPVGATLTGVIRGIIMDGYKVTEKFKIADIDPRESELENCFCISDKARSLGGAVVIAIMSELKKRGELNGF